MNDSGEDLPFEPEPSGPGSRTRRRARHRGSVEALKSGAVRVRVRDVRLPDGRVIDLARTITVDVGRTVADRVKEARARVLPALVRQALDLECGLAAYDASITLAECVARLRADKGQRFAWRRVDDTMWKRCRPLWNLPLASVDVPRVRAMIERWTADGLKPSYVRSCAALVRRVLGRAAERGWLARAPLWPVGLLPSKSLTARGMGAKLDDAERAAVFVAAEARDRECGTDLALRLAFQLDLGLRPIECAWARVSDLREDEGGGAWWFYPARAKGSGLRADEGVDRVPVAVDLAHRIMRSHDALPGRARATGWLFPWRRRDGSWTSRFVEEGGARRAESWITETEAADLRARSGVPFFPYMLRHTRAADLISRGVSSHELQRFGAWRTKEIAEGYAGMVRALPAAVHAPSAPSPGPRLVPVPDPRPRAGFTSGVNLTEARGPALVISRPAPATVDVNPAGAPVGAGGRGRAVGGDVPPTAASEVAGWLDEAAGWASPRAAVGTWHRTLGLAEIRRRAEVVVAVEAAGSVPGREGAVRALGLALASRGAARGVKKATETTEKINDSRAIGGARGYAWGGILPDPGCDRNPPGKKG